MQKAKKQNQEQTWSHIPFYLCFASYCTIRAGKLVADLYIRISVAEACDVDYLGLGETFKKLGPCALFELHQIKNGVHSGLFALGDAVGIKVGKLTQIGVLMPYSLCDHLRKLHSRESGAEPTVT